MHSAALAPNIIEGDLRVLLDPSEPAPNANARRGDCGDFLGHGRSLVLNASPDVHAHSFAAGRLPFSGCHSPESRIPWVRCSMSATYTSKRRFRAAAARCRPSADRGTRQELLGGIAGFGRRALATARGRRRAELM